MICGLDLSRIASLRPTLVLMARVICFFLQHGQTLNKEFHTPIVVGLGSVAKSIQMIQLFNTVFIKVA